MFQIDVDAKGCLYLSRVAVDGGSAMGVSVAVGGGGVGVGVTVGVAVGDGVGVGVMVGVAVNVGVAVALGVADAVAGRVGVAVGVWGAVVADGGGASAGSSGVFVGSFGRDVGVVVGSECPGSGVASEGWTPSLYHGISHQTQPGTAPLPDMTCCDAVSEVLLASPDASSDEAPAEYTAPATTVNRAIDVSTRMRAVPGCSRTAATARVRR
jgi:hypothetical protein